MRQPLALCADRKLQAGCPLFDVRVHTFDAGLPVIGFSIAMGFAANVARGFRHAWYCVPFNPRHLADGNKKPA